MYSPKIKEELIPKLYLTSKKLKMPMTKLINRIIKDGLLKYENKDGKNE